MLPLPRGGVGLCAPHKHFNMCFLCSCVVSLLLQIRVQMFSVWYSTPHHAYNGSTVYLHYTSMGLLWYWQQLISHSVGGRTDVLV